MTETQHTRLALKDIKPSPTQPRKHFDQRKLHELAVSIGPPEATKDEPAGRGVLVPVMVRPVNGHYELIAGERRVRASEIAGWGDVPAVIVKMSDVEVAETQLIENGQRDDITAIEEAAHYDLLIKKHKHTVDTLVARTGKSHAYIYARLGLLKLGPLAKKALAEGKLQTAIATDLVVTVGDPKLQEQFVRECLGQKLDYKEEAELAQIGIQHECIGPQDEKTGEVFGVDSSEDAQPLSYRAARELLRRKYSTKLALAKFDIHDATLTKAGACGPCPHRSGNQLDLLGIGAKQADDVCTKPSCFEEKTQAVWKIQAKEAEGRGLEIIEHDDAKSIFFDSGDLKPTSRYVDPNDDLPPDLARAGSKASWAKLLGKRLPEIPRVLVQDITGAPRELIVKSKAVDVLRELGKIDKPEKPKKSTSSSSSSGGSSSAADDHQKYLEQQEKKRQLTDATMKIFVISVAEATAEIPEKKELALWRFIAKASFPDPYDLRALAEARDVDAKELVDEIDKAKNVDAVRSLLIQALLCRLTDAWNKDDKALFQEGCKLFGVDYDKAEEKAKADAKEADKAEKAAAKEKEKKDDVKKDAKPAKAKKAAKKAKKGGKK